jgi:hypothetical protein
VGRSGSGVQLALFGGKEGIWSPARHFFSSLVVDVCATIPAGITLPCKPIAGLVYKAQGKARRFRCLLTFTEQLRFNPAVSPL